MEKPLVNPVPSTDPTVTETDREARSAAVIDAKMTVAEAGRRGGQAVRQKYGSKFFAEIGQKGGRRVREKYGASHFSEIGQKGGEARRESLGQEGFVEMGRLGGEARADAVRKAKAEHAEQTAERPLP